MELIAELLGALCVEQKFALLPSFAPYSSHLKGPLTSSDSGEIHIGSEFSVFSVMIIGNLKLRPFSFRRVRGIVFCSSGFFFFFYSRYVRGIHNLCKERDMEEKPMTGLRQKMRGRETFSVRESTLSTTHFS